MPESGAGLPNTSGAERVQGSRASGRARCPRPFPPNSGGRWAAHRPRSLTASGPARRSGRACAWSMSCSIASIGQISLADELAHPGELFLELGIGREVPRHRPLLPSRRARLRRVQFILDCRSSRPEVALGAHGSRGSAGHLSGGRGRAVRLQGRGGAGRASPAPARCSCATRGRRWTAGLRLRVREKQSRRATFRPSRYGQGDGRDHDGRRGAGVARGGLRAGRHRVARVGLAGLRGRPGRQARPRRRRDAQARSTSPRRRRPRTSASSGGNGLTAYAGLFRRRGAPGEGDVVWVSAAAGSVGGLVVQIARSSGRRVVGGAGSPAEVAVPVEELGSTRRSTTRRGPYRTLREACSRRGRRLLRQHGGAQLEAAIEAMRTTAASPCVEPSPSTTRRSLRRGRVTSSLLVAKNLTIRGFRGSSHVELMDDMLRGTSAAGCATGASATRRRSSTASRTPRPRSPG